MGKFEEPLEFEGYKERPEWKSDRQEFVGSNLQPFREYEAEMNRQEAADAEEKAIADACDEFEQRMEIKSFDQFVKAEKEFPKWE